MPDYLPGERVRAKRRQSRVVILTPPHRVFGIALLVLLVGAIVKPQPVAWVLGVLVALALGWRWLAWREEWVVLTNLRLIRTQGLPETTEIEAFLRVDRISGIVLKQSIMGKLLHYGTIDIEAPGAHPAVRHLEHIADVVPFYLRLRNAIFLGDEPAPRRGDPDQEPFEFVTAPLPQVRPRDPRGTRDARGPRDPRPPRDRFGRRQGW